MKKKAELFNGIDHLLKDKQFDQAIENLNYLLRNAPSRNQEIRYKLAQIFFSENDHDKALITLSPLLPSSNMEITELVMQSLISLGNHQNAFHVLINSSINNSEKQKLYRKYLSGVDTNQESTQLIKQVDIHCSYCGEHLFFSHQKLRCLKCHSKLLSKFLA